VIFLARQTFKMDSPCPVVDTAPDLLSAYPPDPEITKYSQTWLK
jgi:hypothetical protein